MNFTQFIGRALGIENVQSIDQVSLSFGAAWAERNAAWLLFGCLAVSALAGMFYLKFQPWGKPNARLVLAVTRARLLSLILAILADPVMVIRLVSNPRPLLWVLFDGTDSMAIEDEMSDSERSALAQATGVDSPTGTSKHSRQEYVRAMLMKKNGNLFEQLETKYRLKPFVFDRGDGVRALESGKPGNEDFDAQRVAEQLTTTGQVTALGKALEDLSLRHATSSLDGLVVISDFEQNSGPPSFVFY